MKRDKCRTMTELTRLAVTYEELRELEGRRKSSRSLQPATRAPSGQVSPFRNAPNHTAPPFGNSAINRSVDVRRACRRYGEAGHFQRECQGAQILFCWDCGRRGIKTRDCRRAAQPGHGGGESLRFPKPEELVGVQKGRIVVIVMVAGHPLDGTIDTGATRSFVGAGTVERLKLAYVVRDTD